MVIPKEIRRTQRIRQGDALEIFTAGDGQVVFKKYSPLGGLGQLAGDYAAVLAKSLGCAVVVCDRGSIIAAAGLLSGFTDNWRPLLEGVNIGGLGTPVASLASLITLKLYLRWPGAKPGRYLAVFTLANLAGLAVLLAAAYFL